MSKFKIGDRVRILDGRHDNSRLCWVDGMNKYIGEVHIVKCVDGAAYYELEGLDYLFADEWLAPAGEFTKDDLREFDIVEFRNDEKVLITMSIVLGRLGIGGFSVDTWDDDLKDNTGLSQYDIMKVYRPTDNIPTDKSKWKDLPVVYERTEVKEMTVEEISKALGYEVKVVK